MAAYIPGLFSRNINGSIFLGTQSDSFLVLGAGYGNKEDDVRNYEPHFKVADVNNRSDPAQQDVTGSLDEYLFLLFWFLVFEQQQHF